MTERKELPSWVRTLRQMGQDLGIGSLQTKRIEDALMPLLAHAQPAEDERVKEIRERRSKITSPPWRYDDRHSAVIECGSGGEQWIMQSWSKQEQSFIDERENGEFIAHAPNDIDYLLSLLPVQPATCQIPDCYCEGTGIHDGVGGKTATDRAIESFRLKTVEKLREFLSEHRHAFISAYEAKILALVISQPAASTEAQDERE